MVRIFAPFLAPSPNLLEEGLPGYWAVYQVESMTDSAGSEAAMPSIGTETGLRTGASEAVDLVSSNIANEVMRLLSDGSWDAALPLLEANAPEVWFFVPPEELRARLMTVPEKLLARSPTSAFLHRALTSKQQSERST